DQILRESEIGRQYRQILGESQRYPIVVDSLGSTLSFPPIINGDSTKIDNSCRNLFVEVTATDLKAAEDMLAIIAMTLYDAGFKIGTVVIDSPKKVETPQMNPKIISSDVGYINEVLGLRLNTREAIKCLKKSRL